MNMEQPWMINPQQNPPPRYEKQPQMSENEAQSIVMGILSETMMMGANDYEFQAISAILTSLKAGQINGEQAVKEATHIKNSKNAYH